MPTDHFVTFNEFSPTMAVSLPPGSGTVMGSSYSTRLRNRSMQQLDDSGTGLANPPFDSRAAGRIMNSLADASQRTDVRVLRGFIRRSVIDSADPTSRYRLYFMFNPESIQRTYVTYLDQQALDPFNTIFGSQNLVAPPGVLDFSFELYFDRQTENANGTMPRGVLEDFDLFDLVIRGVVPDPQSPDMPDNGVLMLNPRNLTVVFSPQISVQGRPQSASVTYEKFDHRMRPIRMRINISMKAYYVGPVRSDFTFAQTDFAGNAKAVVPYDETFKVKAVEEEPKHAQDTGPILFSFADSTTSNYQSPYTDLKTLPGKTGSYTISSGYGPRGGGFHGGIDFSCPTGTPALAPVAGEIVRTDFNSGGFGNYVVMHAQGLALIWGHLASWSVSPGQQVAAGTVVGLTDNTGSSTGPHLHFEIREGSEAGRSIDPSPYLVFGWQVLG